MGRDLACSASLNRWDMMSKLEQLHFRKYSKRGPLSSVLMYDTSRDDDDVLTIFWNDLGLDPPDEEAAGELLQEHRGVLLEKAVDPVNVEVEKGVRRDPTERPEWQKNVVYNLRKKAGV